MIKKFLISKNILRASIFFGLLCAVFLSFAHFNAACDDLKTNVLRLHIIANSDSEADQSLKLKIRDRILENSGGIFETCDDIDNAIIKAKENTEYFTKLANEVIKEEGFTYKAVAKIDESYFETREYDDFTLPAGSYNSLIVTVGEGKGKNWWCVVFPEICLPAAAKNAELSDTVCKESAKIAESGSQYVMKFKAVEIYESIKKFFIK